MEKIPLLFGKQGDFCISFGFAFFGIPIASGSAKSLRSLPLCCSPVVALSELPMNLS